MNLLTAARTGWGKSWTAQAWAERNAAEYDRVLILDWKDEFAGLVEHGVVDRLPTPAGATALSARDWRLLIEASDGGLQVARAGTPNQPAPSAEEWREIAAAVAQALGGYDGTAYVVVDEAHRVAPQSGQVPEPVETLATTTHGPLGVCMWVTQRLTELDETPVAQSAQTLLGGFESDRDLAKISGRLGYPEDLHRVGGVGVGDCPDDLLTPDGTGRPLRRFTDNGETIGSEWIYATGQDRERMDSREWSMNSTHYASARHDPETP